MYIAVAVVVVVVGLQYGYIHSEGGTGSMVSGGLNKFVNTAMKTESRQSNSKRQIRVRRI